VLTGALVTRLTFEPFQRNRVTGVQFSRHGNLHQVRAKSEVVLSLGAIHTPKVLMQSGIGDRTELQRHGIPVVQHLPGLVKTFRTIPDSTVSGNINNPCHRATTAVRRPISGRATPI
jgi:choline dehydrogenase